MKRISKVEIRYYRSIKILMIDNLNDLNIFSGGNDVGKSNVLKALDLFFNEKIINVETPTNQKVDVEYTGTDGTNKKATSDVTPSIMLKKDVTPEPKPEEPKDNSIAPNPIPQTGDNLAFVVLGMVVLAVGIVIYIRKR